MTTLDFHIARADSRDAAELTAIAREAKAHWGYRPAQIERWHEHLRVDANQIAERPFFVAHASGDIAGFYGLALSSQGCELAHLWMRPTFMRRGIGRALLAHALATVRAGGGRELRNDADPFAEAFYLACGAKRVGAIAAPLPEEPERVRPQLVIPLT